MKTAEERASAAWDLICESPWSMRGEFVGAIADTIRAAEAEARAVALEEAAKVADAWALTREVDYQRHSAKADRDPADRNAQVFAIYYDGEQAASRSLASRIRELAAKGGA